MRSTYVSSNFKWSELDCKDGTPYPRKWAKRARKLCKEAEIIRVDCGDKSIKVGSAYRTPSHNRRSGGKRKSWHIEGRALDLYPPHGMSQKTFYNIVRKAANNDWSRIWGLGRYPTFVHIDIRPRPPHNRLVCWRGNRVWAEDK